MPDLKASDYLNALKQSHQSLLDALVIAAAALKGAGKSDEAEIAERAIRTATNISNGYPFKAYTTSDAYVWIKK